MVQIINNSKLINFADYCTVLCWENQMRDSGKLPALYLIISYMLWQCSPTHYMKLIFGGLVHWPTIVVFNSQKRFICINYRIKKAVEKYLKMKTFWLFHQCISIHNISTNEDMHYSNTRIN